MFRAGPALALAVLLTNAGFVGAPARAPAAPRTFDVGVISGWHVERDRDTGVVARMWGRHVDAPGAMLDPAIAERAARDFLAAHLADLAPGAAVSDFVVAGNRIDGGLRTVAFAQTWRGLRVVGGQLHVVFAHDRLFFAASQALPHVHVDRVRAGAVIVRDPAARAYRLATKATRGDSDIYVDDAGRELRRDSRVSYATSTLRFDVPVRRPTADRVLAPAPRANLTANGKPVVTSDAGDFTWTGRAPAMVQPTASGPLVVVTNAAGPPATAQLTAQDAQPVDWSLATDELGDAQLTAFVYGMVAKARARQMHPTLAWLDQPLPIFVNDPGDCNASSTADELHFVRASAACENTGRLVDVVLHEFAHALHRQSIIAGAGAFDAAMSEGIADFYAAHLTGDPGVGRGMHFDDTPIRDLDPDRVYPGDVSGSPHATGLIIGGALWDLRGRLYAELGPAAGQTAIERIYIGILERAVDLPSTYTAALVADDDDGDLGNGTPHGCAIEAAFGRHGLAGPGFVTTELAARADGRTITVDVATPTGGTCPPPAVTSIAIDWQVGDGPASTLAMAAQGAAWSAELPDQPAGTVVTYRITATLDDASTRVLPDNRADPRYQLFVGAATPIACEHFDGDPGWTVTGKPEWEVAAPAGFGGDPAAAFSGSLVLGTDLVTNGLYQPNDDTAIETPPIDARGYSRVHLQFRRWLGVEDGNADTATIDVAGTEVWRNAASPALDLDHVDKEWRFVDVDITDLAAEPFTIRWALASNGLHELAGWNLDDVCVVGLDPAPPPDDPGCCSTGGDPRGPAVLALGVIGLTLRRRRRSA
ncbi:MAG TPA: MYXO-CTERM sorting domain-containing protein [Kofleriaceae bacterium]|nr:MYXO-CTERM sorting domain-containing protein [Kofleriaceae bacterium]